MNRSSRKKIHSTEKHEMELRSCLISNQKLIRSSKEIFNFAEKIASECSLLTSDLILAAVWHCLNQTQPTESSTLSNIAVESSSEEHRIQKQDKDRTRKKPVSDSEENRACQSTENAVNENKCDLHADKPKDDREIKKKQPEKEAARNVDAENDEKKEVWIVGESESKTDDIDKQQINQLRSHSDTASGDQSQTIVTNGPDSQNNTEVDTKESKGVCEITNVQNYSSSEPKLDKNIKLHNRTNVATKETNEQVNIDKNVNKFNVTRDENKTDTQDLSVQEKVKSVPAASLKDSQSKQNEGKGQNEKKSIADVEVISIDDEDSNDIPGGLDIASITEFAVVARDKNEEIAEEKEPDYFDMDCDEIDDDNDGDEYEEMLDFTTDETDKSEKYKEESNVKTNTIQKDADVTIISDDEDDCEVKGSAINALTSPSKCESLNETGNRSNTGKSQLNTTSSKKQAVSEGTRRKQSLTNVMEDLTGSVEEKTKGKGLMDRSGEKVHTRIICPAMEHLDSMSMPKDESSSEHAGDRNSSVPSVSDSDSTSTSAVAVLGLMPVGDVQKSVDSAASTTEESSLSQIFPTLASNQSIYVSSSMVHGSIPSLPPVQDLHHVSNLPGNRFADIYQGSDTVTCPSQGSSATPGSFQFDQPDLQAQTSYYSEEYSSVRSPGDEFSSPPRKKRLLDYDKKWHMEPKFSPEQDKYLALPGGVEGNIMLADWRQPGHYTSVSQFPRVPSIGIEKVDSDYMNYQRMNDESFLDYGDDGDYGFGGENDDKDGSDVNDESSNKRKLGSVRGTRGRGRPRGRGTRGTGRGVRKLSGNSSVRGRGRGSVRGTRRKRGRPVLRSAIGRGTKSRGASVGFVKSKADKKDESPSKFSTLRTGSRGCKIGFYSLKYKKPRQTSENVVKSSAKEVVKRGRGRPVKRALHNSMIKTRSSVDKDVSGASSSTDQKGKRGKQNVRSGRGNIRRRKPVRKLADSEKQQEDVIVID
ncbi:dentin sialophosphoprotein-like isoform X3 [Mercenaria mercenaria]|uniref:dentin sialophosphoprotein-like isoform X3 n=1 Tax=Mercenaria mercenaria TaxID=6596 RepID=UPI00234F515F|nr:dentin sialophosphoprotein-like isoform X3 [Mercenaria mercenaria]